MTIDYAKVEGFLRAIAQQAEVDAETNLDGSDQVAMYVAAAHVKLAAENLRRATQTGVTPAVPTAQEDAAAPPRIGYGFECVYCSHPVEECICIGRSYRAQDAHQEVR